MQDLSVLLGASLPFVVAGTIGMVVLFAIWVAYKKKKKRAEDANKKEEDYEIDEDEFEKATVD